MGRLNTAILGIGFVGQVHLDALRRIEGGVQVCAIGVRQVGRAQQLADKFLIGRVEADYHKILDDPAVDAVHICTPNALHFEMARHALDAGKHVICEKPLALSAGQARQLVAQAHRTGRRNGVCYNLRFYPLVQQMRAMREAGELGDILVVQGTYSQDWLFYNTDWNWRVDAAANGPSRAMADIGSHWCDMAEHVTGLRITSLCADLQTFHQTRRQPNGSVETFAGKALRPEDYRETPVDTEDFGAVVFRMGERTRGAFTASQVSAGLKNGLRLEIYGTEASVAWSQERPDELWIGRRNAPNQVMLKDPSLLHPAARPFADLPGGHGEGYGDTFKQLFRRFYESVREPGTEPDYPQFADGLRALELVEAELASHRQRAWVDVPAFLPAAP